ncbi:hypothetical protein [Methylocystis echinoides]|uniref:Uncharacterized protein n=1 Tax=Methylocystis echinoides TaxID=29468 RepID=A0A9W6GTS1_9HYPH|nr:hypothetical protein [Methylocystis echinoides]GLI92700.1 hypothetical protein LMG27198_16920 [Methylocystis echinoides]
MTDATTQTHRQTHPHTHRHAHGAAESAHEHAQARLRPASLLESSAGARLGSGSLLIALLWAAVWWALH